MPDLAVIMSIYAKDRLDFVKQSVQSILDQTFTQFHYYLIFDGPVASDVEYYVSELTDKRIRHFKLEKNGGLAGALNYLLEIILKNPDYRFIARMDADDISMPERFEKQYNFLNHNPDIAILGCWYEEINEQGKHLSYRKLPVEYEALRKRYFTRTPFAHPSVMYKRSLIEIAGFYPTDTILMEDNVLWGRALKEGFKFANIPEFLLKFRIDKDFYKRRSGIKYGWKYLTTRFEISRSMHVPLAFFFSFILGLLKMAPSFILIHIYKAFRN